MKGKLVVLFIVLAMVTMLPLTILGLRSVEKQATQKIDAQLTGTVDTVANELNGWIDANTKVVETIGTVIEDAVPKEELKESHLRAYQKESNAKNISALFVGFSDNTFIDGSGWVPDSDYDVTTRPWYEEVEKSGKLHYSDPYLEKVNNTYTVSIGVPLLNNQGKFEGVIAGEVSLETITEAIQKINLDGKGYAFLIDKHGTVLSHPNEELVNTNLTTDATFKEVATTMLTNKSGQKEFNVENEDRLIMFKEISSTGWIIGASVPKSAAYKELSDLRNQYVYISLGVLILIVILAYVIATGLSRPLARLQQTTQEMSLGDLTAHVDVKGKDEMAMLGSSFNTMADNIRGLIQQVAHSADSVGATAKDVSNHAETTGKISEQISTAIEELANGATDQAQSVYNGSEMVASMTQSVQRISESVEETVQMIDEANDAVKDGEEIVANQVVLSMKGKDTTVGVSNSIELLVEKSQRIEEIVGVIHNIAAQTNLLALNAAIEAARAGEHGKGFAVVAEEVRKLAEQSAGSSENIIELLKEIQQASLKSVNEVKAAIDVATKQETAVNETKATFHKIKQSMEGIVVQIHGVATSADQLNTDASSISDVISDVAAVAEESAASTEEVSASTIEQTEAIARITELSDELTESAHALLKEVQKFHI
nr:methyl-accepting chemotaxis protein [Bacillus sp. FJAT-50079]